MPGYCCVPKCGGKGGHLFPKNKELCSKWIAAIKKREKPYHGKWEPSKTSMVCKRHFKEEDFKSDVTFATGDPRILKCLKKMVVPSIFEWTISPKTLEVAQLHQEDNIAVVKSVLGEGSRVEDPGTSEMVVCNLDIGAEEINVENPNQRIMEGGNQLTVQVKCEPEDEINSDVVNKFSVSEQINSAVSTSSISEEMKPDVSLLTSSMCTEQFSFVKSEIYDDLEELKNIHTEYMDKLSLKSIYTEYNCDMCHQKCINKDHITQHLKIKTEEKQHDSQIVHNNTNIGENQQECLTCPEMLSLQSNISKDLKMYCGENNPEFQSVEMIFECNVCQKKFSQQYHLSNHKRIHTGDKKYECDVCYKVFLRKNYLFRHKNLHTGDKRYECEVCHKVFFNPYYVSQHKKTHSGEKPYECDICLKMFSHKSYLSTHRKIHSGNKQYECNVCQKKFFHKSNLSQHLKIHSKKKPYKCDVCNKIFSHHSYLSQHRKIHSEEKPYQCELCQAKFLRKDVLMSHIKVHSRDKEYECDVCLKKFSRNSYLYKHKKNTCLRKAIYV
ncbi:zinc finger protein 454-like [Physella acuta]|uniref:zinc finger protein 454-like n=1 Tax=Physella acuta TaxID=109671 RepID=UPI0027DD7338|nr:zinc finger protein 454-like [Physella acuta]